MSKRYTEVERERRKTQSLAFVARNDGVPMHDAPHQISQQEGMRGISADTIQDYLYELIAEGHLYVGEHGGLHKTPEVGDKFKEWIKNGV